MPSEFLGLLVLAVLFAAPLLVERYLRQLPVAPTCPSCAAVASEVTFQRLHGRVARWLSALGRTFVAECARCGWKGRMRWKWAPGVVRGR